MTAKVNQCRDCQPKDHWIEIRLVDEMNQSFGSLTGKLKDASGTEHKVMLSGGYLLLTNLPAGPVELKIETSELLTEAKKHKPRPSPQTSPAREYVDKNNGYEKSKIRYQHVALGDLWTVQPDMPKEHQAGATGNTLRLATSNSYVVEVRCFIYLPLHIAVVGTQYDHSAGNKMIFAAQAIRALRAKSEGKKVLVIFTPDYTNAQLSAVKTSTDKFGIQYELIQNVSDLISKFNQSYFYINPLLSLSFFCHGLPGSLEFGYHLPESANMSLTFSNFTKIKPLIFLKNGRIDSYACRTGMGNLQDYAIEQGLQVDPQPENSLAQKMANYFSVPCDAYIHRSNYENTWGTPDERYKYNFMNARGETNAWFKDFAAKVGERREYARQIKASYNVDGALHPVVVDWDPITITNIEYNGQIEFKPK